MAYPPELPPSDRTDTTVAAGNHATDHNLLAAALASIVEVLGADPVGDYADVATRLEDVAPSLVAINAAISDFEDTLAARGLVVSDTMDSPYVLTNPLYSDLAGLAATVEVPSTAAVYLVHVDVQATIETGKSATLVLSANGNQPGQLVHIAGTGISVQTVHLHRTWVVTGVAAGSRVFKVVGLASHSSGVTANQGATIIVQRVK